MQPIGLYVHTPFCAGKCAYCDFYSFAADNSVMDAYTQSVINEIERWGDRLGRPADTLYFGGGTPTLLGANRLIAIITAAQKAFGLNGAEITVEANPADDLQNLFLQLAKAGVNRISLGMQTADKTELKTLSRRHTTEQLLSAVAAVKQANIQNFSLDVMLGIPNQTPKSLAQTLEVALSQNPKHLSAYMLSIEPDTDFYKNAEKYAFPTTEQTAELYLQTCKYLKNAGFERYEISNFCLPDFQSKHNNKYWQCEEYLGIGPSAHSFIDGKRFFYPADFTAFLNTAKYQFDSVGGQAEEWLMLAMRLSAGVSADDIAARFTKNAVSAFLKECKPLLTAGLLAKNQKTGAFYLTDNGALLSNEIITRLIRAVSA